MRWEGAIAAWWQSEVSNDPAYGRDVDPILATLLDGADGPMLDLGCGDGRLLERYDAVGVDASLALAIAASRCGRVVVADIERLPFADALYRTTYAVLVLEHMADVAAIFGEAARVTEAGGRLAVVLNHPVFTAPGSGPVLDQTDGEALWRWGSYMAVGSTSEPAGSESMVFHHRPLGTLLGAAADHGWRLTTLIERPVAPEDDPLLAAQGQVPRLLGVAWER